jgi:hypothetical protein
MIREDKKGTDYISEPGGCQTGKMIWNHRLIFMFQFIPFWGEFSRVFSVIQYQRVSCFHGTVCLFSEEKKK